MYRKTTDRKLLARAIYDKYIDVIAPCQVNIDGEVRNHIRRRVRESPVDLFDEAQRQIHELMKRDPYGRFIGSPQFQAAVQRSDEEERRMETAGNRRRRSSWFGFPWRNNNKTEPRKRRVNDAHSDDGCLADVESDFEHSLSKKLRSSAKSSTRLIGRLMHHLSTRRESTTSSSSSKLTPPADVTSISTSAIMSSAHDTTPHFDDHLADSEAGKKPSGTRWRRRSGCCRKKSLHIGHTADQSTTHGLSSTFNYQPTTVLSDVTVDSMSTVLPSKTLPVEGPLFVSRNLRGRRRLSKLVNSLKTRRRAVVTLTSASDKELPLSTTGDCVKIYFL